MAEEQPVKKNRGGRPRKGEVRPPKQLKPLAGRGKNIVLPKPSQPAPPSQVKDALTNREKLFVIEYIRDFNAVRAAARVGLQKASNLYVSNASIASKMMAKPEVRAAIAEAIEARNEKVGINAQWVLREALQLYQEMRLSNSADVAELYDRHGNLRSIHEWPEHWRRKDMIKALEVTETFDTEFVGKKKKRIHTGYIKKIHTNDHKLLEATLLKVIGQHVDVAAFKPEGYGGMPEGNQPRSVILKVEYAPAPQPQEALPLPEHPDVWDVVVEKANGQTHVTVNEPE